MEISTIQEKDKKCNEAFKKMKDMDGNVSDCLLSHVADEYHSTEQYGKAIDLLKCWLPIALNRGFRQAYWSMFIRMPGKRNWLLKTIKSLKLNPEIGWVKECLAELARN